MWVRSKYAGELAVLATWANVLIPWTVSFTRFSPEVSFAVVRFPFLAFQFLYGIELAGAEVPVLPVYGAPGYPDSPEVTLAYTVWLGGAVPFAVAVAYSVAYYLREERVEAGPVDPVRVLGALLLATAVALSAATVLLWQHYDGATVPVGVLFLYLFGGVLLTVERA